MSGFPTIEVGVAFGYSPMNAAPVFTDIAADMSSLSVSRGRQSEEDRAQTGHLTMELVDPSRNYDPSNSSGSHYPNVKPMVPVRIRVTNGATTYTIFRGWGDVQDAWIRDSSPGASRVQLPCNDGFEFLSTIGSISSSANASRWGGANFDADQQLSGLRVVNTLDLTPWPGSGLYSSALRDIDAGNTSIQSINAMYGAYDAVASPANFPVLQAIRDAEVTEQGFFYFNGSNVACFRNRHSRLLAPTLANFTDVTAVPGYILVEDYTTRQSRISNHVIVSRTGGNPQQSSDANSQTNYLERQLALNTGHVSDIEAHYLADWELSLKKDSYEVLESITLIPGTDSDIWDQVLGRELNDRITVVRTPAGGGTNVARDYFIEGLTINLGPGASASCTWRLSAAAQFNYWRAGTIGSSEAGSTTRAVY